jgi:hypothetical protein
VVSLQATFVPELLSMNCLMAAMIPTAAIAKAHDPAARNPASPVFWFVMSMALMLGAFTAYPMNWWLVKHGLKHGMLTVRSADPDHQSAPMGGNKCLRWPMAKCRCLALVSIHNTALSLRVPLRRWAA